MRTTVAKQVAEPVNADVSEAWRLPLVLALVVVLDEGEDEDEKYVAVHAIPTHSRS
jgi:hypothetical protein